MLYQVSLAKADAQGRLAYHNAGSANRQQHAVTNPAGALASEELHVGDQLGPPRDEAGTGLGAGAQPLEPLPRLFSAKTELHLVGGRYPKSDFNL